LDPEKFKGVRLISYARNFLRSVARFMWHASHTQDYRRRVEQFATELCGITHYLFDEPPDIDWLSYFFPSWFWRFNKLIDDIDHILTQPDLAALYRYNLRPSGL